MRRTLTSFNLELPHLIYSVKTFFPQIIKNSLLFHISWKISVQIQQIQSLRWNKSILNYCWRTVDLNYKLCDSMPATISPAAANQTARCCSAFLCAEKVALSQQEFIFRRLCLCFCSLSIHQRSRGWQMGPVRATPVITTHTETHTHQPFQAFSWCSYPQQLTMTDVDTHLYYASHTVLCGCVCSRRVGKVGDNKSDPKHNELGCNHLICTHTH